MSGIRCVGGLAAAHDLTHATRLGRRALALVSPSPRTPFLQPFPHFATHPMPPCPSPSTPAHSCLPAAHTPQGLAFISRRKKGALLSVSSERVVLVWKKSMPDGSTVWSGPIFLKGKSWGAGFTVGELWVWVSVSVSVSVEL